MSTNVTMRQMLEAGVHFGHQTRFWNPKMAKYIFGGRNKIHIINLERLCRCSWKLRNMCVVWSPTKVPSCSWAPSVRLVRSYVKKLPVAACRLLTTAGWAAC